MHSRFKMQSLPTCFGSQHQNGICNFRIVTIHTHIPSHFLHYFTINNITLITHRLREVNLLIRLIFCRYKRSIVMISNVFLISKKRSEAVEFRIHIKTEAY